MTVIFDLVGQFCSIIVAVIVDMGTNPHKAYTLKP